MPAAQYDSDEHAEDYGEKDRERSLLFANLAFEFDPFGDLLLIVIAVDGALVTWVQFGFTNGGTP